ncbi:hypothetical protein D3OALGA1CA_2855 [Olavius algarvensis associated proteobacterium Delta 3]|nr:hypothetical protein D3OALGA1CA_2855 [Olavius algarvensis associated proteobacterium Delta 3]CAB5163253.1 hypothetical protein D3OALGB2SA_5568 [Olavius algarvensis associated proteobacterium Delta 3]
MNITSSNISFHALPLSLGLVLGLVIAFSYGLPAVASDGDGDEILGIAIKGYDPVAYFTEGKAVKGTEKYAHHWNEAEWHFASGENRDRFAADPEAYAPSHGGF